MKYGFIGTGNMGGALAKAAAAGIGGENIVLANRTPAKAEKLVSAIGATITDNRSAAKDSDVLFLGVKPQMMADMLAGIADVLAARTDRFVLVSMAAGHSIEAIQRMAGGAYPVIRIMPNTPVEIGQGMILYTPSPEVTEEEVESFVSNMKSAGRFDRVNEAMIQSGGTVTGCGPAFVYLFLEALADGAVACGVPRAKAYEYAAQMTAGAAEMVLTTGRHPGALKDAVCSPAGSTIAGVETLEENAFRSAVMKAVIASDAKGKKLG